MDRDACDFDAQQQSAQRKGKGRAIAEDASETTPLLATSTSRLVRDDIPVSGGSSRRRLYLLLSTVFFTTLCVCVIALLVVILLAYSYSSKVSNVAPERLLDRAVMLRGPQRIDVLNTTEGTIWLQVEGAVGIDADAALDTVLDGSSGTLQRWLGRWAIRQVGTVTVNTSEIAVVSKAQHAELCSVLVPPIQLPLTIDRPQGSSWLTKVSFPVRISVTPNSTLLEEFVRTSWKDGYANVEASVANVSVYAGSEDESGWKRRLRVSRREVQYPIHYRIPSLPGLPSPGKNTPFPDLQDLVTLDKFYVNTHHHNVAITANATAVNPLPESWHMNIPAIPFTVFLPNSSSVNSSNDSTVIPIVTGNSLPFSLTHPNITLDLSASILQITQDSMPVISSFISTYLSGHSAPFVAGSPLLPSLHVPMVFPAPHPKPQVLRDVSIRNMHISLNGEVVLASGTVYARAVLPLGIRLSMDVERIWPDVLVFDGKVPDEGETRKYTESPEDLFQTLQYASAHRDKGSDIPRPPLPDPLPENAFARIRPGDWLPADSIALPIPSEDGSIDDGTSEYIVTADIENVPLEVLPGRQKLMSSFVAKVLFGPQGALAGVQGTAAVAALVDGLPVAGDGNEGGGGIVELLGLPFTGSFRVGKKAL